jgi:hypothetical protein
MISCDETLKMQKVQSEAVNYRRKDNNGQKAKKANNDLQNTLCFVDRCLSIGTFSFDHCVVCSSSINGF